MKTIIKTIGTTISVLLIILGLTALFTIDNAQGITGLIAYAAVMIISNNIDVDGGMIKCEVYDQITDISQFLRLKFDTKNDHIINSPYSVV